MSDQPHGLQASDGTILFQPSADSLLYVARQLEWNGFRHDTSWYWSTNYPQPKKSTSTNKVEEANMAGDFQRIPIELVQMIAVYLDGADFISIRASCRNMRSIVYSGVDGHTPQRTLRDRAEFAARLYVDRYSKMAKAEQMATLPRKRLLCSFCLLTHPKSAFQATELAKTPYERQCIGTKVVFRACKHKTFTYMELPRIRAPGTNQVLCNHQDHSQGTPPSATFQGGLCIRSRVHIGQFSVPGERTPKDVPLQRRILANMEKKDCYICPHLRSSEDQAMKLTVLDWVVNGYYRLTRAATYGRNFCSQKSESCKNSDCAASFGLTISCAGLGHPSTVSANEAVKCTWSMEISRNVGHLRNILDPSWIAKCEQPEENN